MANIATVMDLPTAWFSRNEAQTLRRFLIKIGDLEQEDFVSRVVTEEHGPVWRITKRVQVGANPRADRAASTVHQQWRMPK